MIATIADIQAVRPVASNIDNGRIAPYIEEIEELYVIKALGAELYKQIDNAPTEFALVLSGGYYDDDKQWFGGLKKAIAYMVYSRFLRNQNMNVTAFGAVIKNGTLSDKADDALLARMANEAQSIGEGYLNDTIAYCKYAGLISCTHRKAKYTSKFKVIGD